MEKGSYTIIATLFCVAFMCTHIFASRIPSVAIEEFSVELDYESENVNPVQNDAKEEDAVKLDDFLGGFGIGDADFFPSKPVVESSDEHFEPKVDETTPKPDPETTPETGDPETTLEPEDPETTLEPEDPETTLEPEDPETTLEPEDPKTTPEPVNPSDSTTADPADSTTTDPADSTTADPADSTTTDPADSTTTDPADSTTGDPANSTTTDPADSTTTDPADTTTADPADSTTGDPGNSTTTDPADSTTVEPSNGTTANPISSTTSDPGNSTTTDPADSTTVEPSNGTTANPISSTTSDPAESTTDDPSNSTINPTYSTTVDPTTTAEAPGTAIGQPCKDASECINWATCENDKCRCMPGTIVADAGMSCRRTIGQVCEKSADCIYNAICTDTENKKMCACNAQADFQMTANSTRCGIKVDGKCTPGSREAQCIDNAECQLEPSSPNYFCKCLSGFTLEKDGMCSGGAQLFSSFFMSIIAVAAIKLFNQLHK